MSNSKDGKSNKPNVNDKKQVEGQKNNRGNKPNHRNKSSYRGKQGRKDSGSKRVNFDNAREDKVAKQIMADAKSGKFNDINDFLRNPVLVQAAASLPVFPILGENVGSLQPVSGVMQIAWQPNFGNVGLGAASVYGDPSGQLESFTASKAPKALNQAADSTYSFLVHANSRNYAYISADLFILIIAGSQVFAAIEAMKRAYGIAKRYMEVSSYTPNTLLCSMGFDPQDLRNHLGQAWFDINNLIVQTRQIWVPNVFPIVTRWMDMNSNLYKDAEGAYAQTYVFVQNRFFQYDETKYKQGGSLVPVLDPTPDSTSMFNPALNQYSWSTWVNVVQGMIDALIASEDRGIIYGDLLNAYTAERIIALPEVSVDYMVEPEYTPEVSMQIENLSVGADWSDPQGLVQANGRLFPLFNSSIPGASTTGTPRARLTTDNQQLNFHIVSDPSPEMILTATRFMDLGVRAAKVFASTPSVDKVGTDLTTKLKNALIPITRGSEYIDSVAIYTKPVEKLAAGGWSLPTPVKLRYGATAQMTSAVLFNMMSFDWHPFLIQQELSGNIDQVTDEIAVNGTIFSNPANATFGDHDKYTDIVWQELSKMNAAAELSLWGVPQI